MADLKISALPASTTPLAGTEVVPLVQSSTTKKVAVSDLTAGRSVSVGNLTVTTAATTALGSANITTTDPTLRMKRSGGTTDKNTYEFRAVAAGAGFDYLQLRKINDATTVFTELFKFDNDGDQTISLGNLVPATAGKGINFTANTPAAGMTSQLLNWYEEGTWTPAMVAGTSGTITSGNVGGKYTRIGRQVTMTGYIDVASVSVPVGALTITGLPFACGSGLGSRTAAAIYPSGLSATAVTSVVGRVISGESEIRVDKYSAGTTSNMAGDVIANSAFHFSVTYFI